MTAPALTRDMVTAMEPGPELDALVARHVLGHVWNEARCRVCGAPVAVDARHGCVPGNCSMRPVPRRRRDAPLEYSTTAAGWLVLAHLDRAGYAWDLSGGAGAMAWAYFRGPNPGGGARDPEGHARRPTLPHAIAIAALLVTLPVPA